MDQNTAIVLSILTVIILILCAGYIKMETNYRKLSTQMNRDTDKKTVLMKRLANHRNVDYFAEMLANKIIKASFELAQKRVKDKKQCKLYQRELVHRIEQKFKELNATLESPKEQKNGKLLIREIKRKLGALRQHGGNHFTVTVSDADIQHVVDQNDNLIYVLYPSLQKKMT